MSVINIDFEQAKTLLSEVVEEAGEDFVYHGECMYSHWGEPGCIVGRVLAKAGVPSEVLTNMDRVHSWSPVDEHGERIYSTTDFATVVQSGAFSNRFTVEHGALELLHEAQARQDARDPWGEVQATALTVAEAILDEANEDAT
jgi:hypothetical protein